MITGKTKGRGGLSTIFQGKHGGLQPNFLYPRISKSKAPPTPEVQRLIATGLQDFFNIAPGKAAELARRECQLCIRTIRTPDIFIGYGGAGESGLIWVQYSKEEYEEEKPIPLIIPDDVGTPEGFKALRVFLRGGEEPAERGETGKKKREITLDEVLSKYPKK